MSKQTMAILTLCGMLAGCQAGEKATGISAHAVRYYCAASSAVRAGLRAQLSQKLEQDGHSAKVICKGD